MTISIDDVEKLKGLKTAEKYAAEIAYFSESGIGNAIELTTKLNANFASKNAVYADLEVLEAQFTDAMLIPDEETGKYPPSSRIKAKWDGTDNGILKILLHREIQSLAASRKAMDNMSFNMRTEMNMQK